MIITKTPFRVSLCGGGSDLPAYYEKNEGCVISTSINKYVYIASHPSFRKEKTILKYSETETVEKIDDINHPIFRECLRQEKIDGIEITSMADIPKGTGLGSSSSFTVGLLNNLKCYQKKFVSKRELAEMSCDMEINVLNNPIGKQDQYAAAFGGLNFYKFNKDGSVDIFPIIMHGNSYKELEDSLIMLYVGGEHNAAEILKEQSKNICNQKAKETGQKRIVKLTYFLKEELEKGNIDVVGQVLDENWKIKKTLANGISNERFDSIYKDAINSGATGGKILGAGGSGFFLFYVPKDNQENFRKKMHYLPELEFKFDHLGSTVIFID